MLRERLETQRPERQIVGESPALRKALERAAIVAGTGSTILLLGETGTGKGLLAGEIHRRSGRADGPIVDIDCTALPPTLIESELFGYEKGAFSGADRAKPGRLELADGGTLLLDEIGELPGELQAKFLRVLETGEMSRLGSTRTRRVDVRIIAATNRDLEAEVAAGRFRADLYHRISVFPIVLPPLRERTGDVPILVWFFVERLQPRFGRHIERIPESSMAALEAYDWPGNIRELRNVVERSLILTEGGELAVEELAAGGTAPTVGTTEGLRAIERQHIRAGAVGLRRSHQGTGRRGRAPRPQAEHALLPAQEARHRALRAQAERYSIATRVRSSSAG